MYPTIFHIYGPFKLHSFSFMLALGIMVFMMLTSRALARKKLMDSNQFFDAVVQAALVGLIGARVMHIISESGEYNSVFKMLSIWNGGMSVFGSFIGIAGYALWYLRKDILNGFKILDVISLYIPLVHAIARVGCFLAGCCYGVQTSVPWSIMYTNSECAAPLFVHIHATQLYSAAAFVAIFFILWVLEKKDLLKTGQYTMAYVFLSSCERLLIDFLRGDRIKVALSSLSFHQWIALCIIICATIAFFIFGSATQRKKVAV